jgi:ABC-type amino acid transport substrate-binding protein
MLPTVTVRAQQQHRKSRIIVKPLTFTVNKSACRIAGAVLIICLATSSLAVQAELLNSVSAMDRIKRGEPIRLGYRTNSPPLSFARDGIAAGYTVDLCRAALGRLAVSAPKKDINITYVPVTIDNRLTKVASGEIDMECGLTSNTVSRAKQVAFSPIVLITGTKFAVTPDSPLIAAHQLQGKRVAAGKGTTNLRSLTRYAADRGLKLNVVETTDTKAAFTAVSQGVASAAAINEISAIGWSREQPQAAVRLLDRYLSTEPVAVSLPKHDPEFVRAFSAALADVLISGEAERIYQRWLGNNGLGLPLNQLTREAYRVPIVFSVPDELL